MIRSITKAYIENGIILNPSWTDRIAVSYIRSGIDTYKPYLALTNIYIPTTDASATFGRADYPDQTIPVVASVECKYYWEVYNTAGTLIRDVEPFTSFYAPSNGVFYARYQKVGGVGGDVILDLFADINMSNIVYKYNSVTGVDTAVNESAIVGGLNDTYWDTIADGTQGTFVIKYSQNVVASFPSVDVAVAGVQTVRAYFTTNIFTRAYNDARFYFPTIGGYMLDDKSKTAQYLSYDTITCDYTIKKSDIVLVSKLTLPRYIDKGHTMLEERIIHIKSKDNCEFDIVMGEIENKSTWTNDAKGLEIAYKEIQEWLI